MNVRIEDSWNKALKEEFERPYFTYLVENVKKAYQGTIPIYPKASMIFRAFDLCPIDNVRVVILGQDPYHGKGQAEGLAFSVPSGVKIPPSLVNIKKEILSDLSHPSQIIDGNLLPWVEQGVFLLNSVLTVQEGNAGSHHNLGWETFTNAVLSILNKQSRPIVFLLWGAFAWRKGAIIDTSKHCVLSAPHPSPLSAHRGFFGCKHFSKTNLFLRSIGEKEISW